MNNIYTMIAPGRRDAPGALAFADRLALALQARGIDVRLFGGNYPWETDVPPPDAQAAAIDAMLDEFELLGPDY